MCHRRNKLTVITAFVLVLSLFACQPGLVWRSVEGAICTPCTFADATVIDDCCPAPVYFAATDDCRACCTAAHEGTSPRTGSTIDVLVAALPLLTGMATLPPVARQPVHPTASPVSPRRTMLHGPPGLRAPPPVPA